MKVTADTNILIRAVVGDHEKQAQAAAALLRLKRRPAKAKIRSSFS
jgi:predicted nucleic acid-binding protein